MANEIKITATLSSQYPASPAAGQNPEITGSIPLSTATFTKSAVGSEATVVSVATTAAGVAMSIAASIGTLGWFFFLNLDTTNYVECGIQNAATFFPYVRMNAGEPALHRMAQGISPYWRANTSACNVFRLGLNN